MTAETWNTRSHCRWGQEKKGQGYESSAHLPFIRSRTRGTVLFSVAVGLTSSGSNLDNSSQTFSKDFILGECSPLEITVKSNRHSPPTRKSHERLGYFLTRSSGERARRWEQNVIYWAWFCIWGGYFFMSGVPWAIFKTLGNICQGDKWRVQWNSYWLV